MSRRASRRFATILSNLLTTWFFALSLFWFKPLSFAFTQDLAYFFCVLPWVLWPFKRLASSKLWPYLVPIDFEKNARNCHKSASFSQILELKLDLTPFMTSSSLPKVIFFSLSGSRSRRQINFGYHSCSWSHSQRFYFVKFIRSCWLSVFIDFWHIQQI